MIRPTCLQQRQVKWSKPSVLLGRAGRPNVRATAALVENSSTNASAGDAELKNGDGSPDLKEEPKEFEDAYTIENLSLDQIQELISTVSEETDIAEVHLKLNDIEVRFKRSAGQIPVAAAPVAVPAAPVDAPAAEASAEASVELSVDEPEETFALVAVSSKKVGIFRRCRYVNTKQVGKSPIVTPGTSVKAGQPMGFIEQLGTFSPVEAPMSGEVVNVMLEEGDPVAYDQELFEMNPSMASSGSRIK